MAPVRRRWGAGRGGGKGRGAGVFRRCCLCCITVTVFTTQTARVGVSTGGLRLLPLGVGAACPAGLLWPGHRCCFCPALTCSTEGSRLAQSPLGTQAGLLSFKEHEELLGHEAYELFTLILIDFSFRLIFLTVS